MSTIKDTEKKISALEADINGKEKKRHDLQNKQEMLAKQIESLRQSLAQDAAEGKDTGKAEAELVKLITSADTAKAGIDLLNGQIEQTTRELTDLKNALERTKFDQSFENYAGKVRAALDTLSDFYEQSKALEKELGNLNSIVKGVTIDHVNDNQRKYLNIARAFRSNDFVAAVNNVLNMR